MIGPRAVAIVQRGRTVLVIKRHFEGRDYAVLPGGSVEDGESFEEAAVRELFEESTLRARVGHQLFAGQHNGREARYFVMADVEGTPRLSGPELLEHRPGNSFELLWAGAAELTGLGLLPEHLRTDLPRLLAIGDVHMSDQELPELRAQAAAGDRDAVDQLVELAGERGDFEELRSLAAAGSRDAVDVLVELAGERGDLAELRRLAAAGSSDAAEVLAELTEEDQTGNG